MNYAGVFTDKEGNKYYPDIKEIKTTGEKMLSSVGWYRVATLDDPIACLISICTRYNNNNNISATLSLNMANSKPTLNKISAQLNSSILTAVRTTKLNGTYYLEVYYNSNSANPVTVNILLLCGLARRIQMLDFVQAEDTETEIDYLVLDGGAIIGKDFNLYNKEGVYKYGGNNVDNRPPNWGVVEIVVAGNYIIQRCSGEGKICMRLSFNGGTTWQEWKSIV